MTTQFQTIEPQAAIPAACPRPRALTLSATAISARAGAGWPRAAAPVAAFVRRPESVLERSAGYAAASRVLTDAVRVEVGGGNGSSNGTAGFAMAGSKQQDPQDQQHLTTRREPVTWRPPR